MEQRKSRNGFSLLEVLVVIAILALLVGLLFPVFSASKEKGRQTVCFSNIQQLSRAVLLYVQDFDEHLPHWYYPIGSPHNPTGFLYWTEYLQPYVKNRQVFHDPSFLRTDNNKEPVLSEYVFLTWGPFGNGSQTTPFGHWPGPPLKLADISYPAQTMHLADGYMVKDWIYWIIARHGGSMNVGFLDGHVKRLTPAEAFSADQDEQGKYRYRYISATR